MNLIDFTQAKRQRLEDECAETARALVQSFQRDLSSTFVEADGSQVNLLSAQRLLCQYWQFEEQLQRAQADRISQSAEVAILEDEERFLRQELFVARRKLALLECPFAERDIIIHLATGLRGWVAAVDWSHKGFLVQVGMLGRQDRPLLDDDMLYLWGPADILGWTKQGEVSVGKARKAGWVDRPV